jgi:hypothetical protein
MQPTGTNWKQQGFAIRASNASQTVKLVSFPVQQHS